MSYNRYIVFAYSDYYPNGGLGDISDHFNDLEEAKRHCDIATGDYVFIIDRDTWEEIYDKYNHT